MSARRTVGVVIGDAPAAVVAEALRAAVGLTLRGDRVEVAIAAAALAAAGAGGARAVATLALFDHRVRVAAPGDAAALAPALAADVVELWGDAAALAPEVPTSGHARLHLARAGRVPPTPPGERVLHLPASAGDLASTTADTAAAASDTHHDVLLAAILAADAILVW